MKEAEQEIIETALEQLPMNFDFSLIKQRRMFLFLVFYPLLRPDSEYRAEVDETYELRHNPVNQHVTLYKDEELIYSSYTDDTEPEKFFELVGELVVELKQLPALLDDHQGPVGITDDHIRPVQRS